MAFAIPEYWVNRLIPKTGKVLVVGKPKVGKSTFIMQSMVDLVDRRQFLNLETQRCRVQYLSLDLYNHTPMFKRISRGVDDADLEGLHVMKWSIPQPLYINTETGLDLLKRVVESAACQILVLDPKALSMSGDENAVKDNLKWAGNIDRLMQTYPALTVCIIHHVKKGRVSGDVVDLPRGSGALAGWADVIIALVKTDGQFRRLFVTSRYEEEAEPVELVLGDRFAFAPEEADKRIKFEAAVSAIIRDMGTLGATELVKKVAVETGLSESHTWRAYREAKARMPSFTFTPSE